MEYEKEEVVLSVRQRSRQNDHAFRLKKRSMMHDSHRFNLPNVAKDLQIPNVDEVSQLSAQLKKKKDLVTLRKLRLGLSVGGDSITAFLNTEGSLYALVGCLTGKNAELQREAIYTIINLGLGTEEQCMDIWKAAGIYVMFGISSKPFEMQGPYAWCIGNLCGGNEAVCKELGMQGVQESLLLLLRSRKPHIFQSAAYALTHYLATVPEKIKTMDIDNVVRSAIDGLENHDGATAEAGWLIFVMSLDHVLCDYLLCQGIIHTVLYTLEKIVSRQSLDVSSATSLLRILLNCVGAFPGSATQVCHRSEQFVSVSKALLYSPHPHLRTETLQMIANVINGASQSVSGQSAVDNLNLQLRLESAVRSALAANFTSNSYTFNTNFDGAM